MAAATLRYGDSVLATVTGLTMTPAGDVPPPVAPIIQSTLRSKPMPGAGGMINSMLALLERGSDQPGWFGIWGRGMAHDAPAPTLTAQQKKRRAKQTVQRQARRITRKHGK